MRFRIEQFSIREKIFSVMAVTISLALLLTFAAFMVNHALIFTQSQRAHLSILAQILADNSQAAVAFNDKATAEELLSALKAEPNIISAAVYDAKGRLFAGYGQPAFSALDPGQLEAGRVLYRKASFHAFWPVELPDKLIGAVYIQSGLGELLSLLGYYALAGLLIIVLCALISFYVALRLQRHISEPLAGLSRLAKEVSHKKNYSLRAQKTAPDEIGYLADSFNEMLAEIEKRDGALTRSNRDLEQFAYVASHDLQEPLRMVSSYADLLAISCEGKLDAEQELYMKYLKEGSMRAGILIQDLLDYSRARSQPRPFEQVRAGEILKQALLNLKLKIEETQAVITQDELPVVYGDPVKLALLFQNLISNALKFRHPDTAPRVHISSERRERDWLFGVKDNGIGIDPQYADRIFVIFQRLHHREDYEGTGIGLAICKTIVEIHGGKIWVEPNPEGGSIFHFTLPAGPAAPTETRPFPAKSRSDS